MFPQDEIMGNNHTKVDSSLEKKKMFGLYEPNLQEIKWNCVIFTNDFVDLL